MQAPLVSLPDLPVPEGAISTYFDQDGIRLRAAKWPARGETPRGTVVLVHGRTEFIEKYFEVIEDFLSRGFAVLSFDWRGQGLSSRELANRLRGHVKSFDDFVHDFRLIVESDFAADLPKPWVLVSHSMGGPVALRYLELYPDVFAKAVFSAPMFDIQAGFPKPIMQAVVAGALALGRAGEEPFASKPENPATAKFEGNVVTSDEARYDRTRRLVAAKPDLGLAGLSWGWVAAANKFARDVNAADNVARIKTPSLFMLAEHEKLVDNRAALRVAELSPVCEARVVSGALHELMMERDDIRTQFMNAFDGFVEDL